MSLSQTCTCGIHIYILMDHYVLECLVVGVRAQLAPLHIQSSHRLVVRVREMLEAHRRTDRDLLEALERALECLVLALGETCAEARTVSRSGMLAVERGGGPGTLLHEVHDSAGDHQLHDQRRLKPSVNGRLCSKQFI